MRTITDQGAVGVLELAGRTADGRQAAFEVVILPLVHGDKTISRYLGAFSAINPPAWLGTAPVVVEKVIRQELVWPEGRPHAVIERAYHQAPFIPQVMTGRIVRVDRRQFRIFDGGRKAE